MANSDYMRGFNKELEADLVAKPACGFHCPPSMPFNCCRDCGRLIKKVWSTDEEFTLRGFTEADRKLIKQLWVDDKQGYLTKGGCGLPRRLRPFNCLKYVCEYAKKRLKEKK